MRSDETPLDRRYEPEGGDAACWLDRVCDECGAFGEASGATCWRCGARLDGDGSA